MNDRMDKLVLDAIEHEMDALYNEFEQYGGTAGMKPVTKYDTWRLMEYQKIMTSRDKWHALAVKFLDAVVPRVSIPSHTKNKIWEQAIKFDCADIADIIDDI